MSATVPESRLLDTKIRWALPVLEHRAAQVWALPAAGLRDYVAALCALSRGAVPLLRLAARHSAHLPHEDPVRDPLVRYFRAHAVEELDHDAWLLEDLQALGGGAQVVDRWAATQGVSGLLRAQERWITQRHPCALLGYVAVLEGYPLTATVLDDIAVRNSLPPQALRTLRLHASLDGGHRDDLFALLDGVPWQADHRAAFSASALFTVLAGATVLQGVVDENRHADATTGAGP